MNTKFVLIIGLSFLCLNICIAQKSHPPRDEFLIVLDIQEKNYKSQEAENSALELTERVNSIVDRFDPTRVVYIKNTKRILSLSIKGISADTLPSADLDGNLKIVSNSIFHKYTGDAFTSAELISFLENNSASNIVMVGRLAEECLYQTALGGLQKGYSIFIVPEAIVGKTPKRKDKAIKKMVEKEIQLLPIKEIIN